MDHHIADFEQLSLSLTLVVIENESGLFLLGFDEERALASLHGVLITREENYVKNSHEGAATHDVLKATIVTSVTISHYKNLYGGME